MSDTPTPMPTPPRLYGVIRRIVGARGFGFLFCGKTDREYFFHKTECVTPFELLAEGMTVYFTPMETAKGLRATALEKVR